MFKKLVCAIVLLLPNITNADIFGIKDISVGLDTVNSVRVSIGNNNEYYLDEGSNGAIFSNFGDNSEKDIMFDPAIIIYATSSDILLFNSKVVINLEFFYQSFSLNKQEIEIFPFEADEGRLEVYNIGTDLEGYVAQVTPVMDWLKLGNKKFNFRLGGGVGLVYMQASGTYRTLATDSNPERDFLESVDELGVLERQPKKSLSESGWGTNFNIYTELLIYNAFVRFNYMLMPISGDQGKHNVQLAKLVVGYRFNL